MALDEHALATLTDEERAAIEGSDLGDEEKAAMEEIVGEDSGDDTEGDDDDLDGDAGDDDPAADVPADDATAEQKAAAPAEPEPAAPEPRQPDVRKQYRAELPADLADRLSAIDGKEEQLATAFKDGELDFDDYRAQSNALVQERATLDRAITKAEIAAEMTQQSAQQEWDSSINRLVDGQAKTDGIDYRNDPVKQGDLDLFIKALAKDSANNDKPMDWFLQEAHKRVKALHGIATAAPTPAPTNKPTSRKPPVDALPKTLAQVPGGDGPGDLASEFANIDSLDGEALEAAIAKMNPTQRERYLKGL